MFLGVLFIRKTINFIHRKAKWHIWCTSVTFFLSSLMKRVAVQATRCCCPAAKNDSHQKPLKGHDPCSAFMTLITVASTQTRSHALRDAMSTVQRSLSSFCAFLMEPARKTRLCTWGLTPPLCCYTQDIIVPCTDDPVRQGQLQPTTRGCKSSLLADREAAVKWN